MSKQLAHLVPVLRKFLVKLPLMIYIYINGKVFKITDNAFTTCYIGSTCESLSQKMARRRKEHRNYLRGCKYFITSVNIFDEVGIDNCLIELIENCPCDTVEQLRKREGHYKQSTDCVNKQTPGRTDAEYREQNREQINQQNETAIGKTKMPSMKDRNKNTPVRVGLLLVLV